MLGVRVRAPCLDWQRRQRIRRIVVIFGWHIFSCLFFEPLNRVRMLWTDSVSQPVYLRWSGKQNTSKFGGDAAVRRPPPRRGGSCGSVVAICFIFWFGPMVFFLGRFLERNVAWWEGWEWLEDLWQLMKCDIVVAVEWHLILFDIWWF